MLIHGFVAHSQVNGPGVRAVVYFQGCNLGCASCWNPGTHPFTGLSHEVEDVAEQIAGAHRTRAIDGVTFSGGEAVITFDAGETIWTESSHKYTLQDISDLAGASGFRITSQWIDEEWAFANTLLVAD